MGQAPGATVAHYWYSSYFEWNMNAAAGEL